MPLRMHLGLAVEPAPQAAAAANTTAATAIAALVKAAAMRAAPAMQGAMPTQTSMPTWTPTTAKQGAMLRVSRTCVMTRPTMPSASEGQADQRSGGRAVTLGHQVVHQTRHEIREDSIGHTQTAAELARDVEDEQRVGLHVPSIERL